MKNRNLLIYFSNLRKKILNPTTLTLYFHTLNDSPNFVSPKLIGKLQSGGTIVIVSKNEAVVVEYKTQRLTASGRFFSLATCSLLHAGSLYLSAISILSFLLLSAYTRKIFYIFFLENRRKIRVVIFYASKRMLFPSRIVVRNLG